MTMTDGRTERRQPPKHGNILVHVKDPARYVFNTDDVTDDVDRERFTLIDAADDAVATMRRSLEGVREILWEMAES